MAVATWVVAAGLRPARARPRRRLGPDLGAAAGDRAGRRAPRRRRPVGGVPPHDAASRRLGSAARRGPRPVDAGAGVVHPERVGGWYVAYVAFRNLKGYVPFVNQRLWDTELHRLDRLMWLGHDPAVVLHHVLGTGGPRGCCRGSTCCGSGWCRRRWPSRWSGPGARSPARCTSRPSPSTGARRGRLLPGPVPRAGLLRARRSSPACPGPSTPRCRTCCSTTASAVLADVWDTRAVQTVAAFASLHVAITVTTCLVAELLRLPRWCA